jgi:hypothetical protein
MKAVLKFQVSVKDAANHWDVSPEFSTYEEAAEWRHKREAQLFKQNPGRRYIPSTLSVNTHYVEDKSAK